MAGFSHELKRFGNVVRRQNKYVKAIICVLLLTVIAAFMQISKESNVIGEEEHEIQRQAAMSATLEQEIEIEKAEINQLKAEVQYTQGQANSMQEPFNEFSAPSAPVAQAVATTDESDQDFLWVSYLGNEDVAGVHVVITSLLIGQGLSDVYVQARMSIFKSITVPTMRAQQSQNFLWLIFIDDTLSTETISELNSLITGHSNFKIVQRNEGRWRGPHYSTDAFPQLNSVAKMFAVAGVMWQPPPDDKNPIVITTRLDSDDGLHSSAILEIQQAAVEWDATRNRLPGFVCWNFGALWMANAENPMGTLATDQPPYGPDTGCLPAGLSMFARKTDQRSVFWEGHTTRIRNITVNNMNPRLGDRLKVLHGNLNDLGIPSANTPMNLPIRARTVTGVGVLGMQSSSLPTPFAHTYEQYKRGLELSFPQLDLKKLEETNKLFTEQEHEIIQGVLGIKCVSCPGATCNPKTKGRVRAIEMAASSVRPDY